MERAIHALVIGLATAAMLAGWAGQAALPALPFGARQILVTLAGACAGAALVAPLWRRGPVWSGPVLTPAAGLLLAMIANALVSLALGERQDHASGSALLYGFVSAGWYAVLMLAHLAQALSVALLPLPAALAFLAWHSRRG